MKSYVCPECGAEHIHAYFFCQTCEADMMLPPGKFQGVTLDLPRHFTAANKEGYTQRELRSENESYFREQDTTKKVWSV